MRTLLKLQEHKHTAKKLPHHHTSYRGIFVVLAATAIATIAVQHAAAASYNVTAKVSAPLPSTAAVITYPEDSAILGFDDIDVKGDCPVITPAIIVLLWRAGSLLGSGVCTPEGHFSIPITLLAGPNALTPKIVNITEDDGPDGNTIVAAYNPPSGIPNLYNPAAHEPVNKVPLLEYRRPRLLIDKRFIVFTPQQVASLPIDIQDGEAPYHLQVNWGDGTGTDTVLSNGGPRQLHHTFVTTISYTVRVQITDKRGNIIVRSIAAVTFARAASTTAASLGSSSPPPAIPQVWIAYGTVMIAAASFWIGEVFHHHKLATMKTKATNSRASAQRVVRTRKSPTRRR